MDGNQKDSTVIAEDVEITGSIKCGSNIQLDGKLNGDLTCNNKATVGATAVVKGNMTAESVTVMGQIAGNIVAKDRIEMKSSAKINGDIKAKRLTVEDGVTFVGKSEVNPSGAPASKSGEPETPTAVRDTGGEESKAKTGGVFNRK